MNESNVNNANLFLKFIRTFFPESSNTPRWIVFGLDIVLIILSLVLSYLVRFDFSIPEIEVKTFRFVFPFVILTQITFILIFKTYAGIIRYTSTRDAFRMMLMIGSGSVFMAIVNQITNITLQHYMVPYTIIIIDSLFCGFFMIVGRLLVRVVYAEISNPSGLKEWVIIYGAGQLGLITKRALDRDAGTKYRVLAFVDDNKALRGKKIEGIEIFNSEGDLENLLKMNDVKQLIIAINKISAHRKAAVIEKCLQFKTKVLTVPAVTNWISGELRYSQIKNVKIEDLLDRDEIDLNIERLKQEIDNKRILITGAAGSIGGEIVRQLAAFKPEMLLLAEIAESPLYELELELHDNYPHLNFKPLIADVRNEMRMREIFLQFKPQIIYHAAAYKHVPMMELNPAEAVKTNVFGTKVVADLAVEFEAEKFVMVSTDKAVNPTNIMGASKRIAEIYTQSLGKHSKTRFITTRFGNVLGSNGSVIPIFKKQIDLGKPITVTHPDITRFFMTIPEACQLVMEAGAIGQGGEIFIFDMGTPVKIAELAKKMIQLSGLTEGKDIEIKYTGLRPGEKLYEELLHNKENTGPTHHEKIMIANVNEYEFEKVKTYMNRLASSVDKAEKTDLVKTMKEFVPEYLSKNSEFEALDAL